jgi:hypothetical protein
MLPDGGGEVRSLALSSALYGGDVRAGIAPLSEAAAAPADASVVRDASGTTLRFTRRLGAAGLPAAAVPVAAPAARADASQVPTEERINHLNWAIGGGDELGYHGANRGSFTQELVPSPGPSGVAPPAPVTPTPPARERMTPPRRAKKRGALPPPSRLRTHGRLMLIAWAGLLPAGAAVGRFVQLPGARGVPFRIHLALQISGVVVATVSFALIVAGAHAHACVACTCRTYPCCCEGAF